MSGPPGLFLLNRPPLPESDLPLYPLGEESGSQLVRREPTFFRYFSASDWLSRKSRCFDREGPPRRAWIVRTFPIRTFLNYQCICPSFSALFPHRRLFSINFFGCNLILQKTTIRPSYRKISIFSFQINPSAIRTIHPYPPFFQPKKRIFLRMVSYLNFSSVSSAPLRHFLEQLLRRPQPVGAEPQSVTFKAFLC